MIIRPITKLFQKTAKLNDIEFDRGIVRHLGFKYTGEIQDILKNGDSICLSVEKGRITKSQRSGKANFTKMFFLTFDKFHDKVYKYDKDGSLVSRMRRTLNGFDFLDSNGNTTKSFVHNMAENINSVLRYPKEKYAPTSIVNYKGSKVHQILSKTPNEGSKVLADFEKGFLNIQQKDGCFAQMQNGILEFKNKNHEYYYDLNNKTLSIDGAIPSLITNHPKIGYDSTAGIEGLKKLCQEFIPEGLGENFFKNVVEPMLR